MINLTFWNKISRFHNWLYRGGVNICSPPWFASLLTNALIYVAIYRTISSSVAHIRKMLTISFGIELISNKSKICWKIIPLILLIIYPQSCSQYFSVYLFPKLPRIESFQTALVFSRDEHLCRFPPLWGLLTSTNNPIRNNLFT